jgi:hypothetical protein
MADYPRITGTIRPTPRNRVSGFLADLLEMGAKGYDVGSTLQSGGPITEGRLSTPVSDLLGIPELQRTLNRVSYNEPLTTGTGYTTKLRPDTLSAAMTVAPGVGPTAKAGATGAKMSGTALKDLATSDVAYNSMMNAMRRAGGLIEMLPQEDALMLAQRRAALPIEKGGLGLPTNNTAEQRAKSMEFVDDLYHATDARRDFESFVPSSRGKLGAGVYTSPSAKYTEKYVEDDARIMPLLSRGQYANADTRIAVADAILDKYADELKRDRADFKMNEWKARTNQALKDMGYSGVDVGEERLVFDPENLRSRFAAFDPFRRSTAVATAMGVAAPDLLAKEKTDSKKRK